MYKFHSLISLKLIIIILLLFIFPPKISSSTLSLVSISPGLYGIYLSIGYPSQSFLLLLDTSSDYTWVRGNNCTFCSYTENIYDEKNSISSIITEIPYTTIVDIRGSVSGKIILDDIKIGEYYCNKLEILLASEDEFLDLADGVLGMDIMNKTGANNLIISKLYKSGSIKNMIFSINVKEELNASLTIGEIPKYIKENKNNYSVCKVRIVKNKSYNWNCLISHIIFDNDFNYYQAISIDVIVNFSTGVSGIYIPLNYIDLFINNYFHTFINYDNKKCIIKKISNTQKILCLTNFINENENKNIYFILNGFAYNVPFEDLFDDIYNDNYNNYKVFKIEFTDTPRNEWYFGTVFLKQYEIVFDGEKLEIGFYNGFRYDFTKFTNDNHESFCWYNFISIVLLMSVLLIPIFQTIWKNKMSENKLNFIVINKNN
jgi:hypothetical protein